MTATKTSYTNSIGVLHRVQKIGLIAGIAAGTILGVPAFITASDALLGQTVDTFGLVVGSSPLITDLAKYFICGGIALGGYGIWTSRLAQFKKMIGLAGVGVALVNLFPMSSTVLFSSIVGGLVPGIGFTVWGMINASQIHMLTLKNSDEVLKKLASKVQGKDAVYEANPDDSIAANFVKSRFGKNKTAQALSFWVTVATIGYVAEAAVQIFYGRGTGINWMKILLSPGGLWSAGWQLVTFTAVLLATIASIEYCVTALMRLHDMQEAIKD